MPKVADPSCANCGGRGFLIAPGSGAKMPCGCKAPPKPSEATGGGYIQVDAPAHYIEDGLEPIEVIEIKGHGVGFCTGNAIKYLMRSDSKDGLADLKKARWYVTWLIGKHEGLYGKELLNWVREQLE